MENQVPIQTNSFPDIVLTTEARIITFLISQVSNSGEFLLIQEYKEKQLYFDWKFRFGLL